jgi:hypothetical protein
VVVGGRGRIRGHVVVGGRGRIRGHVIGGGGGYHLFLSLCDKIN